ncbi:MAG: hypothetical protein IAF94_12490 [Pirellulaceae bacterium]|nr:hypothetical protein [Pirellulaceae bacterium]
MQKQTGGLLKATVIYQTVEEREVIGFEVTAVRTSETARLFEIRKSPDLEYPAEIIPPDDSIPDFLPSEFLQPGMADLPLMTGRNGRWITRMWVASSPAEFIEKLGKLLTTLNVKAILLSMLSKSGQKAKLGQSSTST